MNALLDWLDHRTGYRALMQETLYEPIPGGAKWRYVWGSTLVFAFVTQLITGIFLWMSYSPSSRTAWESVYYIQYQMQGGWLLRGIHHYMAQAMVVLLALHLLQVVIDGAYRAPRELNFWIGLLLMMVVMGLGLTGYLLPWDQKGFWATAVATNLMGFVPIVGDQLQKLVVGGDAYGHHTLTRFFALHAGVLPGILIGLVAIHIALFRKHGIHTRSEEPVGYFWPDQVLRDAVACLAVLAVVLLFCLKGFFTPHEGMLPGEYLGAHLSAPADPSEAFPAARPEWYFLFLFEGLKYFTPETLGPTLGTEFVGAIVVPGLLMGLLFLMPILGRWRLGHGFNIAMLFAMLVGAGLLTARALQTDYYSTWSPPFVPTVTESSDDATKQLHAKRMRDSQNFLIAKADAEHAAHRVHQVIQQRGGIPYSGAIELMATDSEIQGPRLFKQYCASCHSHLDKDGHGIPGPELQVADGEELPQTGAPNLYGFGSREWIAGVMDPEQWSTVNYFGATAHAEDMMQGYLTDHIAVLNDEGKQQLKQLVAALSAEAKLPAQAEADAAAEADGTLTAGREALVGFLANDDDMESSCIDCHKFHDDGDLGSAPDLTGFASEDWLVQIISNPEHERFYESNNDRMPAFIADPESDSNVLSPQQARLISRWIRGDDR